MQRTSVSYANPQNDTNGSSRKEDPLSSLPDGSTFKPWRVFINHIDSYHGKTLVDLLSERVYVNPRSVTEEGLEEEEEEEEEGDETIPVEELEDRKDDEKFREAAAFQGVEASKKYEVIGTTSDSEFPRPEDVTMIIKDARNREALLKELMNCGIVIYDITGDKGQVEEARWALKGTFLIVFASGALRLCPRGTMHPPKLPDFHSTLRPLQQYPPAIVQELEKTEQKAPKAFKRNDEVRYFVLISTLMTWAHSKPLSPEEPDLPFTEEDYRKRKPHPNYKEHIQCEKEVVMVKKKFNLKDKLKTLVISCGVTYGDEQGPLHYLFKMAWKNAPFLPIFGKGNNKIPLLHVRDLSMLVLDMLQNWPPLRYVVAAEQELISQSAIVKKISRALSNGKAKNIEQEEAFLLPEVTQQTYDLMTANLNIDPEYIVDRIAWHLDMPFRDSLNVIVKEYKAARNLYPMKIIVLGPPASGKTRVALYLAKHYDIHYVHVKSLIANMVQALSVEVENATSERDKTEETGAGVADDDEEDPEEDEEATNVEDLQELLDEIEENMQRNKGRLDDAVLNNEFDWSKIEAGCASVFEEAQTMRRIAEADLRRLFLRKLRSKECLNQGYVVDGYPKTLAQARELFEGENLNEPEEDVDEEAADTTDVNYSIMPELVVSLEATDEFLKERIIQRPEREIQGSHYTEEHMIRRLKEYRRRNTDENTPLQFFDEIEIHPLIIDVENDICPDMFPTIYQCLEKLGLPRNYGLTAEEARDARKRAEAETRAAETAAKLQQEKELLERKRQREEKMAEWTSLMEKLKEEEEERLCLMGQPLRHYLVKYIFPTLTQGLIEVANLRPDDPIDFLAEYLFKENPEGKMFEPDYTGTMNSVLDVIEKFQDDILPPEELGDEIMEALKRKSKQPDVDGTTSSSIETDVCTSRKIATCVTPSFAYDDTETYEGKEETGSDKTDCDKEDA